MKICSHASYSADLLTASLQMLKAGRESLRNTNNWDCLSNVLSLLKPVAVAADVLAEGLCIPSRTLWGSLGLVVEAVSGNRNYLDYVLHLYEDLLRRLPRVEAYSPHALRSPALRLALSDAFDLHSSLTIRCIKTFGRASKQGILTKIRWMLDQHNFEQDLQMLDHVLRKVEQEAGYALHLERKESEERRYAELMEKQDGILASLADKPAVVQAERFTVPWPRSRSFIGRESILTEIHSHLGPGGREARRHQRSVAICGLGGVGKTQIALEYTHLHKHDYQACFWVTCDARVKIASAFCEIARVLGFADRGPDQNLMHIMDWFRTTTDTWLLIFDNAEEPGSLEAFWPPSANGSVLLTTQDTSWIGQEIIGHGMSLRSFGTDDGVKLLQGIFSRWKRSISRGIAQRIVHETGGLPLALRQIGSYICTIGSDPEDFLARYSEAQGSTLIDQWSESTQPSYPRTLATFLDFSFNKLTQQALSVLAVFCFLDVDNVWVDVLSGGSPGQLFHADSPE
ncbi:P-loop containing nucleoside triphosphate hydrolase protein [Achaetomium macrosporum]|uniref:P-loop containing nucleoside triphosphate hydrolase protein n=1 Tax=Achaetomium macrosporum TaxID=79813 RepID=A0AAN7C9V6_9PEZI|nr:P-loop containing nucleoside triphosphate hydrolase protein [Achaetomium macrosporum]